MKELPGVEKDTQVSIRNLTDSTLVADYEVVDDPDVSTYRLRLQGFNVSGEGLLGYLEEYIEAF